MFWSGLVNLNKTKMNSLKTVAEKVKHSPQVIRKRISSPHSSYAKVLEGEKSKGKAGEYYTSVAQEVNLVEQDVECEWSVN